MAKKLNQRLHEFLGKHKFIKYTDCIERGCQEYHGNSPSQAMEFAGVKIKRRWQSQLIRDNLKNIIQIHSDSFNINDKQ